MAAEKQVSRKQTLRDFFISEVPNIVTYEPEKVDEGFVADGQMYICHEALINLLQRHNPGRPVPLPVCASGGQ